MALPQIGAIIGGFRFIGGNPNDETAWEPAFRPQTDTAEARPQSGPNYADVSDGYRPASRSGLGAMTGDVPAPEEIREPEAVAQNDAQEEGGFWSRLLGTKEENLGWAGLYRGEPASENASDNYRQFGTGLTEAIAGAPEATAVAGRAIVDARKASADDVVSGYDAEIAKLEDAVRTNTLDGQELHPRQVPAIKNEIRRLRNIRDAASRMSEEDAATVATPLSETLGFKAGTTVREKGEEIFGTPSDDPTFAGKLSRGAGQLVGMAGLGALTMGTGSFASGSGMSSRQMYDEAIAAGATEDVAREAALKGQLVGFSEGIPLMRAFKLLPKGVREKVTNRFLRGGLKVLEGATEEGAQEYFQTAMQNLIAQDLYDPERGWNEGAGESAIIGSILGGAISGPAAVREVAQTSKPVSVPRGPEAGGPLRNTQRPIPYDPGSGGEQFDAGAIARQHVERLQADNLHRVSRQMDVEIGEAEAAGAPEAEVERMRTERDAVETRAGDLESPIDTSILEQGRATIRQDTAQQTAQPQQMTADELDQAAMLFGAGWTPEDIDDMSPEQRDEEVRIAREQGTTPIKRGDAMRRVKEFRQSLEQPTEQGQEQQSAPEQEETAQPEEASQQAADEVSADEPVAPVEEPAMRSANFQVLTEADIPNVATDARTFQYKDGGDTEGVTDRLRGVRQWDDSRAGLSLIYEYADGRRVVADGHQRMGLAKRLAGEGQEINLPARVIREADGYTPEDARNIAAMKNIAEGSGTAIDAAKVLRSTGSAADLNLPPNSAIVRDADGLRQLSDNAFGMVVNEVASVRDGAVVGRTVRDAKVQADILGLLGKLKPANVAQAEQIAREAAADVSSGQQDSLFGDMDVTETLYLERAKVLDGALSRLKKDSATFKTLVQRGETISSAGNRLDQKANSARLDDNAQVQSYLSSQANRKGPISDALNEAARAIKAGESVRTAIDRFTAAVQADLKGEAPKAVETGARSGGTGKGSGREAVDLPTEQTPEGEQTFIPGTRDDQGRDEARDRAEIDARQQQSKMRRGEQSRVEDDAGGLFGGPETDLFAAPKSQEASREDTQAETAQADTGREREGATRQAKSERIEDFGEKIAGAQKDKANGWLNRLREVSDDEIAAQPLSKSWPEPDYQALIDDGADPDVVAFIHAARDEIPNKPRQAWKVDRWAKQVQLLRSFSADLLEGKYTMGEIRARTNGALDGFMGRVALYERYGHDKSLADVSLKQNSYNMFGGERFARPKKIWVATNKGRTVAHGDDMDEAIDGFADFYEELGGKQDRSGGTKFEIRKWRDGDVFIGKKVGKDWIVVKSDPKWDWKDARAYLAENQEALEAELARKKQLPPERGENNSPRVGQDYRNGQNVTPEMFSDAFGFRGVQFGNYVEGSKRQQDLNEAYDGFMDLAAILNLPPKAMSLNGSLGLAFGARGSGKPFKAHYEPGETVINLTKKDGAGSLAHEWMHGVDHYFAKQAGKSSLLLTEVPRKSMGDGLRPEVADAFERLRILIRQGDLKLRSSVADMRKSKPYFATMPEMLARSFESYVIGKLQDQSQSNDYLANILSEDAWMALEELAGYTKPSWPYVRASEMPEFREAYDNLFDTIQTEETSQGVRMYSRRGPAEDQVAANLDGHIDDAGRATSPIIVGGPSSVLGALGGSFAPIVIYPNIVTKAAAKHGLSADQVKAALRGIYDPVMVFDSAPQSDAPDGSLVAVVDVMGPKGPAAIAVHFNKAVGSTEITNVASVHSRPKGQIANWIEQGLTRYVGKRAGAWLGNLRLQLPRSVVLKHRLGKKVLQHADVFKGRHARSQFAPDFAANLPSIASDVVKRVNRIAPGARLEMPAQITGEDADGNTFEADGVQIGNLIQIALDTKDKTFTANHEAIHWLKNTPLSSRPTGLFNQAEWLTLERAAVADADRMANIEERYPDLTREQQIEEAIADMFADWSAGNMQAKGFIRTAFQKIQAFFESLKAALTKRGYDSPEAIFRAVDRGAIGNRVYKVGEPIGNGDSPAVVTSFRKTDEPTGILAYHGSPHDFERFDLSKIGTGEGAQVYGHGLYFAENEGVAKEYRDRLTNPDIRVPGTYGGDPLSDTDPVESLMLTGLGRPYMQRHVDDAIRTLKNLKGYVVDDSRLPDYDEAIRRLELAPRVAESSGHMYEVRINANPDDFLDWDKPLSEQPNILRKIAADTVKHDDLIGAASRNNAQTLDELRGMTGAQYYHSISGGPAAAARELNRGMRSFPTKDGQWNKNPIGIAGIRYLDQGSRGAGEGTRNYVVFDDSLVTVTRKYNRRAKVNTDTPEFKRWFGDSKVVDANGEPLVVYHGTRGRFDEFRVSPSRARMTAESDAVKAFFFSSSRDVAETYSADEHFEDRVKSMLRIDRPNVMETYLSVQNPMDVDMRGRAYDETYFSDVIDAAKEAGHDGVVFRNVRDDGYADTDTPSDVWAVFRPSQIKSVENQGTFDPNDNRIRYSKRAFSEDAANRVDAANRRAGFNATPQGQASPTFATPKRDLWFKGIEQIDDRFHMLQRAQEAIEEARGAPLPESADAYLAQTLYDTKTASALTRWRQNELTPVTGEMRKRKVSMDDLGLFLIAKHARERNALMAQRDPQRFGADGGSGMMNAAADEILNDFAKSGKTKDLEAVADLVYRMVKSDLNRRYLAGLISKAQHDEWTNMYQYYVPLQGSAEREDGGVSRTGRGFDIRGKESKSAFGRNSLSDHPLVMAANMAQEGITRSQKNNVGKAMLKLVRDNPNPQLWELIGKLPMRKYLDDAGQVREIADTSLLNDPTVMSVKIGGKPQYIKFNDPILAAAVKNMGSNGLSGFERGMRAVTRWVSRLATGGNPDFVLPNLQADMMESALTAFGGDKKKMTRGFIKNFPMATKTVAQLHWGRIGTGAGGALTGAMIGAQFGGLPGAVGGAIGGAVAGAGTKVDQKWIDYFHEWEDAGGKIDFMAFRDLDEITTEIADQVEAGRRYRIPKNPLKMADGLVKAIEHINQPFEYASRFAMYVTARENGLSKAQSAKLSLDTSGNYTRKGMQTPRMSAAYAFFNPAVKGIEKFGRLAGVQQGKTLDNIKDTGKQLAKGKLSPQAKVLAVYAATPIASYAIAQMISEAFPDDDDPEKIPLFWKLPSWERSRAAIIPTGTHTETITNPDGTTEDVQRLDYTPVRIGHNLRPLWTLGYVQYGLEKGYLRPQDAAAELMATLAMSFNPMGSDNLLNAIAPTVLDPLVEIEQNRTFMDTPVHPDEAPWNVGTPKSRQYFARSTSDASILAAQGLNDLTGGTDFKPGVMDLYPNDIEYVMDFITGGTGRFLSRGVQFAKDKIDGVDTPASRVPIGRMFHGETTWQAEQELFYRDKDARDNQANALRQQKKLYDAGDSNAITWEQIEEQARLVGAKVQKGKKIDWSDSAWKIYDKANDAVSGLRSEITALQQDNTMPRKEREAEIKRVEGMIEAIMRNTRRDHLEWRMTHLD